MNLEFSSPIEVKRDAITHAGTFAGHGAIFGNRDSFDDVIAPGAFRRTLAEWAQRGQRPAMLLGHGNLFGLGTAEDSIPVGQWTRMEEDARGLAVEGQLFALDTQKGKYIYAGLKSGVLSGLSIGFTAVGVKYAEKAGDPNRVLTDVTLHEVSIVTFPANPDARVEQAKTIDTPRQMENFLRRAGLSRRDAKALLSGGWPAITRTESDLAAAADELRRFTAALRG